MAFGRFGAYIVGTLFKIPPVYSEKWPLTSLTIFGRV